MIPKKIHYCWFGRNPKPKLAIKCIKSWKKYCPDYELIEWNEDNFDLNLAPLYVRQAYEAKKWAFVTDYVRLKVVYDHGGIYLDTDVEVVRTLDELLVHSAFFGFEGGPYIATGLGFGAEKCTPIVGELMADYQELPFVMDNGQHDLTSCPVRNTAVFIRHGLRPDNTSQLLDGDICILSTEWLCPFNDWEGQINRTKNTVSIHWYSASWETEAYKKRKLESVKKHRKLKYRNYLYNIRYFPNSVLYKLFGEQRYTELKRWIKRRNINDS